MMRVVMIPVDQIYVPSSQKKDYDEEKVMPMAEDILDHDDMKPIYVREGKGRYVLQSGIHRLEAVKLLGEEKIKAYIVQARKF